MKIRFEKWKESGDIPEWSWEVDGQLETHYYNWVEPRRPFPDDRWESAMMWLTQFLNSNKLES